MLACISSRARGVLTQAALAALVALPAKQKTPRSKDAWDATAAARISRHMYNLTWMPGMTPFGLLGISYYMRSNMSNITTCSFHHPPINQQHTFPRHPLSLVPSDRRHIPRTLNPSDVVLSTVNCSYRLSFLIYCLIPSRCLLCIEPSTTTTQFRVYSYLHSPQHQSPPCLLLPAKSISLPSPPTLAFPMMTSFT